MKYIKKFEAKKHKYKVGDWVLLNIEDYDFVDTGEIISLEEIYGRPKGEELGYVVDIFTSWPDELDHMRDGDSESRCVAEEKEIERRLNKKEIAEAKLKKSIKKFNV